MVLILYNILINQQVAQQSVHLTGGILRHFRAFSTPEQNPALKVLSTPAHPQVTQTVGRLTPKKSAGVIMDNPSESENINASLGKHLKAISEQQAIIAEQQKRQTEYLRNISAVLTFLLIAVVLFLVLFSVRTGIF